MTETDDHQVSGEERLRHVMDTVEDLYNAARRATRARHHGTVTLLLEELDELEAALARFDRLTDLPLVVHDRET